MARQAGSAEAGETAEAARRQIRRVDAALRGFLALSAGDAAPAPVELAAVARDVALESLQSRPGGAAVPVEVEAPAGPLALRGVEAELRAALQSLVVNAVEASPPGGRVRVALHAEPHGATFEVHDDGRGMDDTELARAFEPFWRGSDSAAGGTGLGLHLVRELVEAHGGTVEAHSAGRGRGSSFVVRLPHGEPA